MLNVAVNPCTNAWEDMEKECALLEIHLGKQIVDKHLETETKLTCQKDNATVNEEGCVGILVQGNICWDKQLAGRTYNSDSGTTLVCGNIT
jgi:hypothetical protein